MVKFHAADDWSVCESLCHLQILWLWTLVNWSRPLVQARVAASWHIVQPGVKKKTLYNLEQGGKNIARKADVRCQDMEFETWNVNHIMWSIPIYQGIWWSRILFPRPLLFKILIWGFQGHNLFACVIWRLCWRSSSKHPLFTTLSPPQCRTYTHLNTHSLGHTPTSTPFLPTV